MEIGTKKIPISIHPFFLIVVALFSFLSGKTPILMGIWAIVIFISILLHEMGHALTALYFGQKVRIEFVGFGGMTHQSGRSLKLWQHLLITLNGPLVGLALCTLSYWTLTLVSKETPPLFIASLQILFWINLVWTVLNLLPVQPLDGGQLLKVILTMCFGLTGTKIAFFLSLISGALLTVYLILTPYFIAGILFMLLTFENFKLWREALNVTKSDQNPKITHLFDEAKRALSVGDSSLALEKLVQVRTLSKRGIVFIHATELLAELLKELHEERDAFELLFPLYHKISPSALRLLHDLAHQTEHWSQGVEIGKKVYQLFPDYHAALLNAFCHAGLRQVHPAIEWLKCAVNEGLPNLQDILEQSEWDSIRKEDEFIQWKMTL